MARLKNWSVFSDGDNFTAPELWTKRLQGNVYGHPRFKDGDPVNTSGIIEIIDKGTHKEVKTQSGSVYELYKVDIDPECEKQFPNYYERLKLTFMR